METSKLPLTLNEKVNSPVTVESPSLMENNKESAVSGIFNLGQPHLVVKNHSHFSFHPSAKTSFLLALLTIFFTIILGIFLAVFIRRSLSTGNESSNQSVPEQIVPKVVVQPTVIIPASQSGVGYETIINRLPGQTVTASSSSNSGFNRNLFNE